ncbi:MAG TPA: hypothetical protein GX505_10030 [Clostridiales bacterium]|nr:hypothetical protein [Clostridiales bacterium]
MKKRKIKEVLKQLDTVPLPDKYKILSACMQSADFDEGAISDINRRRLRFKPLIAVYAVLFLLLLGFSTYAIAADLQEYNKAVEFFNEYDLPTEGLTKGEIKKIYRDIKTGTFSYSKTADVIEKSIIESEVGGYEIPQDDPTPEDIENLWNYKIHSGHYWIIDRNKHVGNVSYKYYSIEKYHKDLGFDVHDKSIFEKYEDGKLVWSAEFTSFWIENYIEFEDQVIVYGQSPAYSSSQKRYAWMALIDSSGSVLWQKKLDNGFDSEYIAVILPEDEKIVVFSRGDLMYLCLSEYDLYGNLRSFNKTEIGNYGIWNAAKLGDGYIVQLGSYITSEYARIVKVSSDGTIMDSFGYELDDSYYYIRDMIEYNGLVYLSGYSVPVLEDEGKNAGGHYDIAAVLNYIFDNNMFDISNEELTKLMRENFTAVLLVCDPVSGVPKEFYSVKGSLGGRLELNESKKLVWDVESITDTYFSPATSAFTIRGASYVYKYTFDEKGRIISQEKTDEAAEFYR